ncbi:MULTISPECIES: hypothetical protein [unclassified Serratia (in: enterobacteria)]|uniref:hypothetical protein n=1 Tax=unclassified Serratia (in: enterobacteria) TaxID=2647522 RepID=UPI0004696FEB|nr:MULTISPECIES: hypothetical protein [unclassified Serratia (in: enterobacteria)]
MNMRFFSSYLIVFLSSYFFCSHLSAASTGTLTIKFGQTTEDTFTSTHPEAVKVGVNDALGGNIYKEMPNDNKEVNREIVFEGLKNVLILFDKNKALTALQLEFKGDYFGMLSKLLAKKYTAGIKKTSFIGSSYMALSNEGVSIYLMRSYFFSNTSLLFIKTKVKDEILTTAPEDILGDEEETLDYIVQRSFSAI